MDLTSRKSKLNKQITIFKWIGGISALVALIPLVWAGMQVFQSHSFFKENELGDFIGGTSGTFASFAALAFVYVGFLGQQLQILMQQEELEMNRQELKDTREEIKGQREQLELQNKQFQIQSFETVFFNLISLYKDLLNSSFHADGQVPQGRIKGFESDLKHQTKWTESFETDQISLERRQAFMDNFSGFENQVEGLIRAIYGVCVHVYFHREIINEKYFLGILYRQLNKSEINLIFYGFFSKEGMYLPNQQYERLLAEFFRTIDMYKLFIPTDINLFNEIPKPDPEFLFKD